MTTPAPEPWPTTGMQQLENLTALIRERIGEANADAMALIVIQVAEDQREQIRIARSSAIRDAAAALLNIDADKVDFTTTVGIVAGLQKHADAIDRGER